MAIDHTTDLAAAFERFQEASADARRMIEATPRFRDNPDDRALAYSSLCEAQAMAYNFIVAPRMDNAKLFAQSSWHSYLYTLGTNCQDFRYAIALLDGRQTYRLRGRMGDLRLLLVQMHSTPLGHAGSEEIGNYDFHDFAVDEGGGFEVVLSAEPHDGNWIRLDGESRHNFMMVRRILGAMSDDPGALEIQRAPGPAVDDHRDPAVVAERIELAGDFLRFLVSDWTISLYDMYSKAAGGKNRLALIGGQAISDLLGSPSTTYGLGVYELESDEVLLVEWEPPDSAYWSFQLADVWSKALDFEHYQTDLNMRSAVLDADGRFRAVVSGEDPGVPNWLDTRGHAEGILVMRNYRDRGEAVAPEVAKIARAELHDRLPADTPAVSAEERRQTLEQRRRAYRDAYGG